MLNEIGVANVEELFKVIPEKIRFKKRLELPYPTSEYEVRKHVETLLSKNKTCNELLAFLGGGCWPHYIPAVCDEINSRSEFLTAYSGDNKVDEMLSGYMRVIIGYNEEVIVKVAT